MFAVNNDLSVHITRGDIGTLELSAAVSDEEDYEFKPGDIVRFRLMERNKCENVLLRKDVEIIEPSTTVIIDLVSEDTKIGDPINKPKDYWYEVELNPDTHPQTIIGYDVSGPKIFRLYPEGADA